MAETIVDAARCPSTADTWTLLYTVTTGKTFDMESLRIVSLGDATSLVSVARVDSGQTDANITDASYELCDHPLDARNRIEIKEAWCLSQGKSVYVRWKSTKANFIAQGVEN
jgi:Tfp pilus assembly protein PilV